MKIEKVLHKMVYFILTHSKVRGFLMTENMFSVNAFGSSETLIKTYNVAIESMLDGGKGMEKFRQ